MTNRQQRLKFKVYQMAFILSSINVFPESRLIRIRGQSETTHACGGIATLIMFAIVAAVMIIELKTVFERIKVDVSYSPSQNNIGIPATLSTYSNLPNNQRFMLAYRQYGSQLQKISAVVIQNYQTTSLTFQNCTIQHFDPLIQSDTTATLQEYQCLTLNQSFELKGYNQYYGGTQLKLIFDCSEGYSAAQCLGVSLMIMQHSASPYNYSNPWLYGVQFMEGRMMNNTLQQSTFKLDKTTLKSKPGLLPFQSEEEVSYGISANQPINNYFLTQKLTFGARHEIVIGTSYKQQFIERKYYTFLDALAYLGGILSILYLVFFFMSSYRQKFYEMYFAKIYLRSKEGASYNFGTFLGESIYNLLVAIGCKPNWEYTQKRVQVRKTVKRMLSLDYMQRRIEFLENAISVVLEKYQLKGLYFLERMDKMELDRNYHEYRLRDRLMVQARRNRKEKQSKQHQKHEIKRLKNKESERNGKQRKQTIHQEHLESIPPSSSHEKNISMQERLENKSHDHSCRHLHEEDISIKKRQTYNQEEESDFKEEEEVDLEKDEDQDERQLEHEVEAFLKEEYGQLVRERENPHGDKTSIKILERMDPDLRNYFELQSQKRNQH